MRRVIWLHTPTLFWLGGRIISHSCSISMGLVRQTDIHTAEPLMPELSAFEAIEKLKRHKSPVID